MPGLSKRMLKPDPASVDPKRKNSNQKPQRVSKRIRVIYSDPDATDSSSDDEQQHNPRPVKRCIKVIRINSEFSSQTVLNQKGVRSTSKFVGVRQRKPGRWVAEIKDPLQNIRHWLGTFDTEEAAHMAYEKKRLEFQSLLVEQKKAKASPTSVLYVSNTTSHDTDGFQIEGVEIKPKQIQGLLGDSLFFEGELKFVFDELKEEDFLMCNLGDLAELENASGLLQLDMEDFSWLDEVLKCCCFEGR